MISIPPNPARHGEFIFRPTDYAINSNLQLGFKRYFNDDTNKWVNKGLCIIDGKLLDTKGVFVLKK